MKHKFLLWLAVASISTAAWGATDEPNTMYVHHTNGTLFCASLEEDVVLQFLNDNMQISVLEQENTLWEIDAVEKITFGITEKDPSVSTEIESITPQNSNVRKVLENGQVIIIRDGIRYSILGVRL